MDCILVLGPRSSGTRYMTKVLLACGCWGSDAHFQPLDALCSDFKSLAPEGASVSREVALELVQKNGNRPAVLRRSLPHGSGWPNLEQTYCDLAKEGIRIAHTLFMCRDAHAVASSMLVTGHEESRRVAKQTITAAYKLGSSFGESLSPTFTPVIYERLGNTFYVEQIVLSLGLAYAPGCCTTFRDENRNYYEQRSS